MEAMEVILAIQAFTALYRVWVSENRAPTAEEIAKVDALLAQLSPSVLGKLDAIGQAN